MVHERWKNGGINNVKLTRKELNNLLDDMTQYLLDNEDVIHMLALTTEFNITSQFFQETEKLISSKTWYKEIKHKIKIIDDIVERRRINKGETSRVPAWDIFILKAYHRKVEEVHLKTHNQHEHEGEVNFNIQIDYGFDDDENNDDMD